MSAPARVACLVLAHTDAPQLQRLVRRLAPAFDVYVHVDARENLRAFRAGAPDAVRFCEERERVFWGGLSIVRATLRLLEFALSARRSYSHLILLSGQCYPIAAPTDIAREIARQPQRQFMRFIDMRQSPDHYMNHVTQHWLGDRFRRIPRGLPEKVVRHGLLALRRRLRRKDPLPGIVPCFGSQWWALTAECCGYILGFVRDNPSFLRFYETAFAPDEHFFHTIVANSPFVRQTPGIEPFVAVGTYRLANLHLLHPSLVKVFDERDFDEIRRSGKRFVRKVSSSVSAALLDRIDRELWIAT